MPVLLAARIGKRHGSAAPVLTQLPAGALIATCGPRSENPTFVPAWRKPPTAMTPGQFAGVPTLDPALLPAAATTTTGFVLVASWFTVST